MIKRIFDLTSSILVIAMLSPFFLILGIAIMLDSKGGVFYKQKRVGLNGVEFELFKFRSMKPSSDALKITIGDRDPRITNIGVFIRKYKLDEFPQLINVLKGEMSIVGPRPEVKHYTDMYNEEQRKVLQVKPGLTDFASLEYVDEAELLAKSDNPEQTYIQQIMPAKLKLALKYVEKQSFLLDLNLIFRTIAKIIR